MLDTAKAGATRMANTTSTPARWTELVTVSEKVPKNRRLVPGSAQTPEREPQHRADRRVQDRRPEHRVHRHEEDVGGHEVLHLLRAARRPRQGDDRGAHAEGVEQPDEGLVVARALGRQGDEQRAREREQERHRIQVLAVEEQDGDRRPERGHLADAEIGEDDATLDDVQAVVRVDAEQHDREQEGAREDIDHRSTLASKVSNRLVRSFAAGTAATSWGSTTHGIDIFWATPSGVLRSWYASVMIR